MRFSRFFILIIRYLPVWRKSHNLRRNGTCSPGFHLVLVPKDVCSRAPLPLSKRLFVKTPIKVDFPRVDTFPAVVMRNSKCFASLGKLVSRACTSRAHFFYPSFSPALGHFRSNCFAMFSNVSTESFISSSLIPRTVPSSSTPIS